MFVRRKDFDRAFGAVMRQRAGALLITAHPLFVINRWRIVELVGKTRLPAVYENRQTVEAGGLMSYGVSLTDISRRAARYVDKILRGAQPADLPVQQPTVYEFVINLKTAKGLGLAIPPSLLLRADQIIQ